MRRSAGTSHRGEITHTCTPGMYGLSTENLPVVSTLQAWPHGFESPLRVEVRFCSAVS